LTQSEPVSNATVQAIPEPGQNFVGRGMKLLPSTPYSLKNYLLSLGSEGAVFQPQGGGRTYRFGANCIVDQSPPIPDGQLINDTLVTESQERLQELFSLDARVAASDSAFSVGLDGQWLQSDEQASYYAVKSSFIAIWSTSLQQFELTQQGEALTKDPRLQTEFIRLAEDGSNYDQFLQQKEKYEDIFDDYGTHFVTRVWVGGRALLSVEVQKASTLTESQVREALQVALVGVSATEEQKKTFSALVSSSEIRVQGEGGRKLLLANLDDVSGDAFDQWLGTVEEWPGVIDFEVRGVWTLLRNRGANAEEQRQNNLKADVLVKAYQYMTDFKTITTLLRHQLTVYVARGGYVIKFPLPPITPQPGHSGVLGLETERRGEPFHIGRALAGDLGLESPFVPYDAGFQVPRAPGFEGKVAFIFRKHEFFVYQFYEDRKGQKFAGQRLTDLLPIHGAREDGSPYWPGLPFNRIDAAFYWGEGKAYLFYGPKYVRFDTRAWRVDPGYPKKIQDRWDGVPFERLDAAMVLGQKAYLFRRNQYTVYDMVALTTDPGFPRTLISRYISDWDIPLPPIY